MGQLVNGRWQAGPLLKNSKDGKFIRQNSSFRNEIIEPGPNRYHLYISYACPWASRAMIMRQVKDLEDIVSISVVNPFMGEMGWSFEKDDGVISDPVLSAHYLHQIYTLSSNDYTGKVTVPVLFDLKTKKIINNESSDIIRIFNSAFNELTKNKDDYAPKEMLGEIDELNEFIYKNLNNGVYKSGFATTQKAYEEEVKNVFMALDTLEERIKNNGPYLFKDKITESDFRLFVTLIRFDCVYYSHFKCNLKSLREYPYLHEYTQKLYNFKNISKTVNFQHIKNHYYKSHPQINPTGIVPLGPKGNF